MMFERYSYKSMAVLLVPVLFGALAMANLFYGIHAIPNIGDNLIIALILAQPDSLPTPKYLLGMAVLRPLHETLWSSLPNTVLPMELQNPASFLRFMGILVTSLTSVFMLCKSNLQLRVLFPLLTPIWMLCSSGYVEYYPFIAGIFICVLWYLFDKPLQERSPFVIGVTCALLPCAYLGFLPFSVFIGLVYGAGSLVRFLKMSACACMVFLGIIAILWDGSILSYFEHLRLDANVGGKNILYKPYESLMASESSIFFRQDYVWSAVHFLEVSRMLLLGAGLAPILSFVFFAKESVLRSMHAKEWVLGGTLFLWSLFYILYMVPKFGPDKDVDLFFSTYIVLAFFAGMLVEGLSHRYRVILGAIYGVGALMGFLGLMQLQV